MWLRQVFVFSTSVCAVEFDLVWSLLRFVCILGSFLWFEPQPCKNVYFFLDLGLSILGFSPHINANIWSLHCSGASVSQCRVHVYNFGVSVVQVCWTFEVRWCQDQLQAATALHFWSSSVVKVLRKMRRLDWKTGGSWFDTQHLSSQILCRHMTLVWLQPPWPTTQEHILSLSVKCKQWWRGRDISLSCCAWWGRQEVLVLLQEWWCQFEETRTFWERATCHSSHLTKIADITPQLFCRVAFWEPIVCLCTLLYSVWCY